MKSKLCFWAVSTSVSLLHHSKWEWCPTSSYTGPVNRHQNRLWTLQEEKPQVTHLPVTDINKYCCDWSNRLKLKLDNQFWPFLWLKMSPGTWRSFFWRSKKFGPCRRPLAAGRRRPCPSGRCLESQTETWIKLNKNSLIQPCALSYINI